MNWVGICGVCVCVCCEGVVCVCWLVAGSFSHLLLLLFVVLFSRDRPRLGFAAYGRNLWQSGFGRLYGLHEQSGKQSQTEGPQLYLFVVFIWHGTGGRALFPPDGSTHALACDGRDGTIAQGTEPTTTTRTQTTTKVATSTTTTRRATRRQTRRSTRFAGMVDRGGRFRLSSTSRTAVVPRFMAGLGVA